MLLRLNWLTGLLPTSVTQILSKQASDQRLWSVQLNNGVKIRLERLVVDRTYSGLLEGHPDEELNRQLLEDAILAAEQQFNDWPMHVVTPQIERSAHPRLPRFRCVGFFESFATKDPEMHASALVVVWFQNKSILTGIRLPIKDLDWFSRARDFEY